MEVLNLYMHLPLGPMLSTFTDITDVNSLLDIDICGFSRKIFLHRTVKSGKIYEKMSNVDKCWHLKKIKL
jgi:hypothetical protein